MSSSKEFLEGISPEAVTVLTMLGSRAAAHSVEQIHLKLSWMPKAKLELAIKECVSARLLSKAASEHNATLYFVD